MFVRLCATGARAACVGGVNEGDDGGGQAGVSGQCLTAASAAAACLCCIADDKNFLENAESLPDDADELWEAPERPWRLCGDFRNF